MKTTTGDTSWFVHDRFGLFIHWGLYSQAARHEWVKSKEKISDADYDDRYFRHFDPDLYDPDRWAEAAGNAGMKYFVITTKHHEGFCLWDSQLTDYKATNTPIGRDLLSPMVDAFRSHDMRVGFYHSLIDWHHDQYIIDQCNHPRRDDDDKDERNRSRNQAKYADYLHGQVRELLSQFGTVDILWFDFSFGDENGPDGFAGGKGVNAWRSRELYEMIRKMQPNIVLNDRLALQDPATWDVKTPEQFQPRVPVAVDGKPVVWEACQTFSGSWGYYRDEFSWRSVRQLLTTLIDCVSKDGNLLLNVGPTGRGEFDRRALDRLAGMGHWMRYHDRSIYGCTQAPDEFPCPADCRLTYHPEKKRLYVHLLAWPYKHLHLDGRAFIDRVEYAQFLHDASEVPMQTAVPKFGPEAADTMTLWLPQTEPEVEIPVIELFLK